MVRTTLRDVFRLFYLMRARQLQQTARRTLQEMSRLPPHLIDDVNARGLPPDRAVPTAASRCRRVSSFNNSYNIHKIYSLD